MRGDIFQLETILDHSREKSQARSKTTKPKTIKPTKETPPVSIYNEDDLSHFLFSANSASDHTHYLQAIASAFGDSYPHSLQDYSDECAISTDDEDDDYTSPSTPSRMDAHGLKQSPPKHDTIAITEPKRGSDCQTHTRRMAMSEGEKDKEKPAVASVKPVARIHGGLMSLWPCPIEHLEYDWNERFYD
ncbi:hypothetical protein S40285_10302 [Stachybotrys chlorohalonatus IBT 40285]|uniref:Uncharacterized protein n=1 Tax=Stachybotrys chlorohalonatus (strain IBT 40285) TaxID=1283841 RepID=A0A084QPE7_STAC4|nr:hypothetical protein S40285_10302 [Stachybotrys chlorohalonata IBT 40285]